MGLGQELSRRDSNRWEFSTTIPSLSFMLIEASTCSVTQFLLGTVALAAAMVFLNDQL